MGVSEKNKSADSFYNGSTKDILGYLRKPVLAELGYPENQIENVFPEDFQTLAKNDFGYMAVIHADGNDLGARLRKIVGESDHNTNKSVDIDKKDFFAEWVRRETVFRSIRAGVRKAFVKSLGTVFSNSIKREKLEFQPLMLGGDDLLMVCGASKALPFIREFARLVKEQTKIKEPAANKIENSNEEMPLTIGAGMAIVKENFPFFRAHELAEELSASSKYLKANPDFKGESFVDWQIVTESWYDKLASTRRKQAVISSSSEKLILSGKPYIIEGENSDTKKEGTGFSLRKFLEDTGQLPKSINAKIEIARSQLKRLTSRLPEGRFAGEFAAASLPQKWKDSLSKSGYLKKESPWEEITGNFLTRILDLAEVVELRDLGNNRDGKEEKNG
ncbi:MAG: hypothetical protein HQM08_28820 [Candidatus Riflebacteria bacterium]|nr:hypothetical protein [Candidatus Riflebacteria bacterium]